jgi:ethanolamine utilization protein EutQ (cupin superfamily)
VSGIKVFRIDDQQFDEGRAISTIPVVNAGFAKSMGAGFATFKDCSLEHTVTGYDEVLYVISGSMSLRQGDKRWRAGPGEMLWIAADETFVYEADEPCVTFYSTCPLHMSGSTKRTDAQPEGEPETVV